jgi:gamma-glutamyltranspeptidase
VASPHALATQAAVDVTRGGGNAVDAALTAAFALAVVYPHNTSIGGDLFALVRDVDGTITSVNASGPASANVDPATLRSRYGDTMPVTGVDTITVPGAVAGLSAIHDLGASQPWAQHLIAAIGLASEGAPVAPGLDAAIEENRQLVLGDPGLSAILAPGGRLLRAGDRLVQPALARSLRVLADEGPEALYHGQLGRDLVAGLAARGAQLDTEDLAGFQPVVEPPLHGRFQGFDVWTSGPNSQGFVLLEILGALEILGVDCEPLGRDAGVLSDLFRAGIADRDEFLADPDFMSVSAAELLTHERLARFADDAARRNSGPAPAPRYPTERPKGDTVAVVTADSDGRAVCLIQSLFHSFGAGVLEPKTGIALHNRGSCFSLLASSNGVVAPGRRPPHTLMPAMVTNGDRLAWVLGTMGGRAQPQILTQVLLRLVNGESPDEAVAAPRWVVGGLGVDQINEVAYVESTVTVDARQSIEDRLEVIDLSAHDEETGHAQVVAVTAAGDLAAASDPRSDGQGAVV